MRGGKAKGGERNEMGNKMRNEMRIVFPPDDACKTAHRMQRKGAIRQIQELR